MQQYSSTAVQQSRALLRGIVHVGKVPVDKNFPFDEAILLGPYLPTRETWSTLQVIPIELSGQPEGGLRFSDFTLVHIDFCAQTTPDSPCLHFLLIPPQAKAKAPGLRWPVEPSYTADRGEGGADQWTTTGP